MKTVLFLFLFVCCSGFLFCDDNANIRDSVSIDIAYNEKESPNELLVTIKNKSDVDFNIDTTQQSVPFFITVYNKDDDVIFPVDVIKDGRNRGVKRTIAKKSEVLHRYDLSKVFKYEGEVESGDDNQKASFVEGEYYVRIWLTYDKNGNFEVIDAKVKLTLKCQIKKKDSEVKEKSDGSK